MTNAVYPKFKQACLNGDINLPTADVRYILVDLADYTYSSAHDFLDDVPSGARVAVSGSLTSKTITDGVFNATLPTLSSVTGDPSEALIFYIHTGTEGTSRLICFFDTGVTNLPITPNGGNISATANVSGIFAL